METNKRYAIRSYSDHRTIAWFTAESFDIIPGTALVRFKDKWDAVHSVLNLEPGHYICLFDTDRDTK
jgi:hypothetical protein